MKIVYDEKKNARNVELRGLPFDQARDMDWSRVVIKRDLRKAYPEIRLIAVAPLDGRLHVLCYTPMEDGIRAISFRKANKREQKKYEEEINEKEDNNQAPDE